MVWGGGNRGGRDLEEKRELMQPGYKIIYILHNFTKVLLTRFKIRWIPEDLTYS